MNRISIAILCMVSAIIQATTQNITVKPISDCLYIQIKSFNDDQISQSVLTKLSTYNTNKASAIIIDLRNNNGGFIHEAIELSALFIKNKQLITLVDQNNEDLVITRPKNYPYIPTKKIIILNLKKN